MAPLTPMSFDFEEGKLYILARQLEVASEGCRFGVVGGCSRFDRFSGVRGALSASKVS